MEESRPQNPGAADIPKKVLIFAGATTPEFEERFSTSAKENGVAAVEFVNVPDTPFADPKVALEIEAANSVCTLYEERLHEFTGLFIKAVNSIPKHPSQSPLETKTVHYLCDRILYVAIHVLAMHRADPSYSYVDSASLNRSSFESAVNCLYLLQDKTSGAFASLIANSLDEDEKRHNELSRWVSHKNPGIAAGATQQWSGKKPGAKRRELLQAIGFTGTPKRFPKIWERCEKLGDRWKYLYGDRYRELCGWSHIHMSQVFLAPSHTLTSPNELAFSVNTGTVMLYLAFHFAYLFLDTLTENDKTTNEEIAKFYEHLLKDLGPILEKTGTFSPPSFTVEKK